MRPSFIFLKIAPNSVSSADDATSFKMVQRVKISPLGVMGSPYFETERGINGLMHDSWISWHKGRMSLNGYLI